MAHITRTLSQGLIASSPGTATLPVVPLHGISVLSRLARTDLSLAWLLLLLPQQAGCQSPLNHSSSPVLVPRFPQPLWTMPWYVHRHLRRDRRRGVPREGRRAALAGASLVASCGCVSVGTPVAYTHVSIRRPSTRPNSRGLFVTRVTPRLRACAAISRSMAPIGVPWRSSVARMGP